MSNVNILHIKKTFFSGITFIRLISFCCYFIIFVPYFYIFVYNSIFYIKFFAIFCHKVIVFTELYFYIIFWNCCALCKNCQVRFNSIKQYIGLLSSVQNCISVSGWKFQTNILLYINYIYYYIFQINILSIVAWFVMLLH